MNLLIATTNPGKIKEFREMLGHAEVSFSDLAGNANAEEAPEETGHTFRANACLKASHYAKLLNTYAVADDSGLEVDALQGGPGVFSARWAAMHGAGSGDQANNTLLLKQIDHIADHERRGRFVCVLALADPSGRILLTTRETVEGQVLRAPRGSHGFGYDPLFAPDEAPGKTTAELMPAEKHQISHRGKALRRLREMMSSVGIGV